MGEPNPSLRALAHPTRLRILSLLTGTALSAADVARELDLTHANASYHLRLLADAGELVVEGEERIRGGVAKRYRHPWREEDRPSQAGPGTGGSELVVEALAEELRRRYRARRPGSGGMLTDAELWVTPEVHAEVRDLLSRATRLLHEQAQPPRTPGTEQVALTVAAFPLADPEPEASP